jgi:hypothetical protein
VLEFLTLGEYELVAYTLREAGATAKNAGVHGDVQNGLHELPARLSEPQVVAQLLNALDESARTPVASLLEGLFAELRPRALEPLVAWLGAASASPARAAIERASLRLAGANTGELAKLLENPQEPVVRGALRLVAQLATPAAVPGLARILHGADTKLRAEAPWTMAFAKCGWRRFAPSAPASTAAHCRDCSTPSVARNSAAPTSGRRWRSSKHSAACAAIRAWLNSMAS